MRAYPRFIKPGFEPFDPVAGLDLEWPLRQRYKPLSDLRFFKQ